MALFEGELRPGVFTELMATLAARVELMVAAGVAAGAEEIRDDARNSFIGQHPLGTPSPARQGGPPSRISRTLDESLTWTPPLRSPIGWVSLIGAEPGHYPSYGHGRTDSATYGYYMEMGLSGKRHASYPFLRPALARFHDEARLAAIFARFPLI
jgi:hypothetical protein